jgi:hypothetical protein
LPTPGVWLLEHTLRQDGVSRGNPAMARQRYPGGHCGTWQGGGFLEGQMAGHGHNRFLVRRAGVRLLMMTRRAADGPAPPEVTPSRHSEALDL